MTGQTTKRKPLHIVLIHLDLGIGGAEQLMLNLALASIGEPLNGEVSIFTTHCDQSHCFDTVRKASESNSTDGILASKVHLVGQFLPVNLLGKGTAFCSTIRMMYLTYKAKRMYPDADVFVIDVLPSSIPYLVHGSKSVIYYCHFPDKLLTRDTVNGETSQSSTNVKSLFRSLYRKLLDYIEETTMSYSDVICFNSKFTREEVLKAFPTLQSLTSRMQVLYPAIDLDRFIEPDFNLKRLLASKASQSSSSDAQMPIVSLNRFERKKNIELLLHAYAIIHKDYTNDDNKDIGALPPLVIAGGYDHRNVENLEYLEELKTLANSLGISSNTKFRPSVSDEERAVLLQSAICVVYTPYREHFGIVPLEAMYAGSATIAIKSGGPKETIIDGKTGILVDQKHSEDYQSLASAIQELLGDTDKAIAMGQKGHEHVKEKFGLGPFRKDWKRIVCEEAIPKGIYRQSNADKRLTKVFAYILILVAWYTARYILAGSSKEWKKVYSFD